MVSSKKQQQAADLNRLEAKAASLKATLKVYNDQLATQLAAVKAEFKLTTVEAVRGELEKLAKELTTLQSQRDAANTEALQLLKKME